jgi:histidyl-tRNA synthetase
LNEPSILAEVELIAATKSALKSIGLSDFTVLINDRRLLKALARQAQFEENEWEKVFIELDKLDKIGTEGVKNELLALFPQEKTEKFFNAVLEIKNSKEPLKETLNILGKEREEAAQSLQKIIEATEARFDVTLVRGMNYYTGAIFEIYGGGAPYALAGGGRYDDLIEKISGVPTPACGFSIGFERIAELLEGKIQLAGKKRTAFIVDKKHLEDIKKVMQSVERYRADGVCSLFVKAKNFAYQIKELKEKGYDFIKVYDGNNWND